MGAPSVVLLRGHRPVGGRAAVRDDEPSCGREGRSQPFVESNFCRACSNMVECQGRNERVARRKIESDEGPEAQLGARAKPRSRCPEHALVQVDPDDARPRTALKTAAGERARPDPKIHDQPLVAAQRTRSRVQHRFVSGDERADPRVVIAQVDAEMTGHAAVVGVVSGRQSGHIKY